MSFVEFLIEYYIYIVIVLILLIVTVIGFIVDSKNKDKKKKESTIVVNDTSDDNPQLSNNSGQVSQVPENNAALEQVQGVANVNASVGENVNKVVNSGQPISDSSQVEANSLDNVSFQSINNNVSNLKNSSEIPVNGGLTVNSDVMLNQGGQQIMASQQPLGQQSVENVANVQQVQNNPNLYSGYNLQTQGSQNLVNNVSSMDVLTQTQPQVNVQQMPQVSSQAQPQVNVQQMPQVGFQTQPQVNVQQMPQANVQSQNVMGNVSVDSAAVNGTIDNVGLNSQKVNNINSSQFDMPRPLSLENVNSPQNCGVGNVQSTSMVGTTNMMSNNNLSNNMTPVQSGQQASLNVGMVNNSYQSNVVGNASGASVNNLGQTSSLQNSNIVFTTDGAQPFDITSMFANNQ